MNPSRRGSWRTKRRLLGGWGGDWGGGSVAGKINPFGPNQHQPPPHGSQTRRLVGGGEFGVRGSGLVVESTKPAPGRTSAPCKRGWTPRKFAVRWGNLRPAGTNQRTSTRNNPPPSRGPRIRLERGGPGLGVGGGPYHAAPGQDGTLSLPPPPPQCVQGPPARGPWRGAFFAGRPRAQQVRSP